MFIFLVDFLPLSYTVSDLHADRDADNRKEKHKIDWGFHSSALFVTVNDDDGDDDDYGLVHKGPKGPGSGSTQMGEGPVPVLD